MTLDEFTEYTEYIVDEKIPREVLRDLNLGINVLPEVQRDGGYYVLGHYSVNRLGRHIALFYGSFKAILKGQPREAWERQILKTVKHELQHHIETMAGDKTLAREETAARQRSNPPRSAPDTEEPTLFPLERILRWINRVTGRDG